MKAIVESHEGTVEKFIGDAVMAVFGVPQVHEDDALRACRAAVEMRAALPELGVRGRIGVNTGEVVTGTEERLAAGDAVNVAARLQQAAEPDEILIGQATLELVRGAVESEPVGPLELKGKREAVTAYRLLSVREAPDARTRAASWAAGASSSCSERRGSARGPASAASWSRSSARPGSGSRASSPKRSRPSMLASCGVAAFPTARGSPTGPSWR